MAQEIVVNTTLKHVSAIAMAVVLGASAATSAEAADSGYFVGVDLGTAHFPERNITLDLPSDTLTSRNQKRSDLAWGLNTGYFFSRYFGWELAYRDFGATSAPLAGTSATSSGKAKLESHGVTLGFVGTIPFGNWEASWKAGYLFAHANLSANASLADGPFLYQTRARSEKPYAALGLGYNFNEHWNTGVQVGKYQVGANTTGKVNLVTATLAAAYRF